MWEEWAHFKTSYPLVLKRIKATCASCGWKFAYRYFADKGLFWDSLKIAEVGCGTGTFSLAFSILGAQTTLLDNSDDALRVAGIFFSLCERTPMLLNADVLKEPPKELLGKFDLVSSWGLIEHFTGEQRERVIRYHEQLLSPGGLCLIAAPNRFSPCYRTVRGLRELTGTWDLEVEVPYSYWELKKIAVAVGFSEYAILGNVKLSTDIYNYSKGTVSALLDVLPSIVRKFTRRVESSVASNTYSVTDLRFRELIQQAVTENSASLDMKKHTTSLKNVFSSSLILAGIK
jgi:SAM-dependent methyltransferase